MSDLDEIRYVLSDNGIWYEDKSYLNAYGEFGKLRVPVKTENVNFNIWFIVDPEKYGIQTRVIDFFQFEPNKRDKVIIAANEANSKLDFNCLRKSNQIYKFYCKFTHIN